MELLTPQRNYAVPRLPGRRFPGLVIQGDNLHTLSLDAERAQQALRHGDVADAQDELDSLVADLRELLDTYISALDAAGVALPFHPPGAGRRAPGAGRRAPNRSCTDAGRRR